AAVLVCDNAIPHLLSDEEIVQAFSSCREQLAPDGVLVISARDYANIERRQGEVRPYGAHRIGDDRYLATQLWEWDAAGDYYDLRVYVTEDHAAGSCLTRVMKTRYYAVSLDRLAQLMRDAGFADV